MQSMLIIIAVIFCSLCLSSLQSTRRVSFPSRAISNGQRTVSHSDQQVRQSQSRGQQITRDDIEQADVSILFIGNSHSAPIPGILIELFKSQFSNQKVFIAMVPSWGFLAEHAERNSTVSLIKQGPWDYVVLQAQKYSTSGKYSYPYDGALKLSRIASSQGAKIIMYPEWSRREIPDEYKRINQIHNEIAKQTGAVVAPIGQAWELALKKNSKLKLYASDGNHASPLGSYLNACVFFSMVTGNAIGTESNQAQANSSSALKHLLGTDASSDTKNDQRLLQEAAWSEVKTLIDSGQLKIKTPKTDGPSKSK